MLELNKNERDCSSERIDEIEVISHETVDVRGEWKGTIGMDNAEEAQIDG